MDPTTWDTFYVFPQKNPDGACFKTLAQIAQEEKAWSSFLEGEVLQIYG